MKHLASVARVYRVEDLHEHRSDQLVLANVGVLIASEHLEQITFVIVHDEVEVRLVFSSGMQCEDIRDA